MEHVKTRKRHWAVLVWQTFGCSQSRHILNSFIVTLSAFLCYFNALNCELVFDDVAAIKENKDVRNRSPVTNIFFNDFWGTPLTKDESHKSYRPLCTLTFRLNHYLHGLDPFGYHLTNVVLHCLVSIVFYRLCLVLLTTRTSLISAVLFAVHPIHTEAVTGVVGRAELLSAFFYLCALNFFIKSCQKNKTFKRRTSGTTYNYCLYTIFLTIAGTLCKEQCLTVLPICAIYELRAFYLTTKSARIKLRHKSKNKHFQTTFVKIGILAIGLVTIIFCRLWIIGSKIPIFSRFDNPASVAPFTTRIMTYNFLLALNSWLLIFPSTLCCDWTFQSVPLVEESSDIRNVATIVLYAIFGCLLLKTLIAKLHITIVMGVSMTVLPFIPATNLILPVGFVLAERVLYLPSMGFCILVAYGYQLINKNQKKTIWKVFMSLLLVTFASKTIIRNEDWKNEKSLFASGLKLFDKNLKLLNNYGRALENMGKHEEATIYYRKSIRIEPKDVRGYLNYGKALNFLGRYAEAEDIFSKAKCLLPRTGDPLPLDLRLTTSHLNVFLNLAALIARNQSRLSEADEIFREALSLRSDFTKGYINRGQLLHVMNKTEEAEIMYSRAIRDEKSNADLYNNYGRMLLDSGRTNEALTYLTKALDIEPENMNTLLNLAFLAQETRSSWAKPYALNKLEEGATKGSPNETLYFRIGMACLAHQDKQRAEKWFRKAITVKPTFRSALYNLALLLSEQRRSNEAISTLRILLMYHPDHIKGLLLFGDLHINHERNLLIAQQCYKNILNIEPSNAKALHNLCVVFLEQGNLLEAQACLKEANEHHPDVEYIQNNLITIGLLLNKSNEN